MEIPVYLFLGFLESGKTKFIQETLEDKRFNSNEKTLLLVCEEGIEEYDSSSWSGKNVYTEIIDGGEDLTASKLNEFYKKYKFRRAIIEYNGMWKLETLYKSLPDNWIVYQTMMFADSSTFIAYNANMRALVVDKLQSSQMVVFNRFADNIDKMQLHKIVRGISRRVPIAYEYVDGEVVNDDTEDPLPFDVTADTIEIEDKDYALWYRDLMEEPQKYDGKVIRFKGIVACDKRLPEDTFIIGRHVMTCCIEDIEYKPVLCIGKNNTVLKSRDWVMLTAKLTFEYNKLYEAMGPVLRTVKMEKAAHSEPEIAMF